MDSLGISEVFMQLGQWDNALAVLLNPDVSPSNRLLARCLVASRRDCVRMLLLCAGNASAVRSQCDSIALAWALTEYRGEGAELWQSVVEANGLTV